MTRLHTLSLPQTDPRTRRRLPFPSVEQCERRVVLSGSPTAGVSIVSFETAGSQELVTVTNSSGSPVRVTVADYSFTDNIFNQSFYNSSTVTIQNGATKTISVDLACGKYNQFDVLVNEPPIIGPPNYFLDPNFLGAGFAYDATCGCDCGCGGGQQEHGNEGLGNGVDPPPPGHAGDTQQNDDPGHGPGNPNKGFNQS